MKKKGSMRVSAILLSLFMVCTMIAPAAFAEDNGGQGGEQPPQPPAVYSIEVKNVQEAIQGGSVTVEPTSAEEGKEVKVTVSLLEGYKVKSLKAVKSDNTGEVGITEREGARYFTMPNTNVRVEVEYEAPPTPEPTSEPTEESTPESDNESGMEVESELESETDMTTNNTDVDGGNAGANVDEYSEGNGADVDDANSETSDQDENDSTDANDVTDTADDTNGGNSSDEGDTSDEPNDTDKSDETDGNEADQKEDKNLKTPKAKMARGGAKGLLGAGNFANAVIDFGYESVAKAYADLPDTSEVTIGEPSGTQVTVSFKLPADGGSTKKWVWDQANSFVLNNMNDSALPDSNAARFMNIEGFCLGTKTCQEYQDDKAFFAEYDAAADEPRKDGEVFYVLWAMTPIDSVAIRVTPPDCGTESDKEKPNMTVVESKAGTATGVVESEMAPEWVFDSADPVVLKGENPFTAKGTLTPKWGYYISENTSIAVEGATLQTSYVKGSLEVPVDIVVKHGWNEPVSYKWADDNSAVTASHTCKTEACGASETETVKTTPTVKQKATCTVPLITTYTSAAFENTAFAVQTKDVTGEKDANAHEWKAPVYTWNKAADGTMTVTATRECGHDATHKETETVSATSKVVKAATCTEKGETTYTSATFKNTAFQTQTKTEAVAALGHAWGDPTYEWLENNTKVKATRTCSRCGEIETETVGTEEPVISPTPSPTTKGIKTYKSKAFTNPAFTVQTKQVALVMYTCTEGGGKTWTKGSNVTKDFTFKRNFNDNETFGKFKSIQVNGKTLAESSYKVEAGSLKVHLQPAYLETLSAGTYTMEVQFTDGRASTRFGVVTQAANKNAAGTSGKATTTTGSAAKTGDTSHMVLWLILMIVAAAGCGIGVYLKKRSK